MLIASIGEFPRRLQRLADMSPPGNFSKLEVV